MRKAALVLASIAFLFPAPTAQAVDPGIKCEAGKLEAVRKYSACRLKVEAKAVLLGTAPDFAKCEDQFFQTWLRIEERAGAPGVCPSEDDDDIVNQRVSACTDDVATLLAGGTPPDCPSDLAICASDLLPCDSGLTSCAGALATCTSDYSACASSLAACSSSLSTSLNVGRLAPSNCPKGSVIPTGFASSRISLLRSRGVRNPSAHSG